MALSEDLEICKMLVELKPLLPKAKQCIKIILEELERGSLTRWQYFRPILFESYKLYGRGLNHAIPSIRREKFVNLIYCILPLFDIHKYTCMAVIADVLEILCLIDSTFGICMVMEKIMAIRFQKRNVQTNITLFEMGLVFSYKDMPSRCVPSESDDSFRNWVKILTELGKVRLLKVIVSFGATLIAPQDDEVERANIVSTMCSLFDVLPLLSIESRDEDTIIRGRWDQNVKSQFNESSRKRLFYVNLVLHVLFAPNFHQKADKYIQCIEILTKSTPEPLITCEEIKNFITKICSGMTMDFEKVKQFIKKYANLFPKSVKPSEPRSLKHLSRFQVRENLRIDRLFPHGVQSLHVPKKIKDYILFKDIL